MKKKLAAGLATGILLLGVATASEAALISQEDFESGATGWNNNTVTNGGSTFTNFLGLFAGSGGSQSVQKAYALSGTQTNVTVDLDIYEIDSWDYENFKIFVNDNVLTTFQFKHNRDDSSINSIQKIFPGDDGNRNYGFAGWPDQGYHYSFTYQTTDASFKLGFGSTLDQGVGDEAWGVDNIRIESNAPVPVPATMLLFGSGIVSMAGLRLKRKN